MWLVPRAHGQCHEPRRCCLCLTVSNGHPKLVPPNGRCMVGPERKPASRRGVEWHAAVTVSAPRPKPNGSGQKLPSLFPPKKCNAEEHAAHSAPHLKSCPRQRPALVWLGRRKRMRHAVPNAPRPRAYVIHPCSFEHLAYYSVVWFCRFPAQLL